MARFTVHAARLGYGLLYLAVALAGCFVLFLYGSMMVEMFRAAFPNDPPEASAWVRGGILLLVVCVVAYCMGTILSSGEDDHDE